MGVFLFIAFGGSKQRRREMAVAESERTEVTDLRDKLCAAKERTSFRRALVGGSCLKHLFSSFFSISGNVFSDIFLLYGRRRAVPSLTASSGNARFGFDCLGTVPSLCGIRTGRPFICLPFVAHFSAPFFLALLVSHSLMFGRPLSSVSLYLFFSGGGTLRR